MNECNSLIKTLEENKLKKRTTDLAYYLDPSFTDPLKEIQQKYSESIEKSKQSLTKLEEQYSSSLTHDKIEHKKRYNWLKRLFKKSLRKPKISNQTQNIAEIIQLHTGIQKKRTQLLIGIEEILRQDEEITEFTKEKNETKKELRFYQATFEEYDTLTSKYSSALNLLRKPSLTKIELEQTYQLLEQLGENLTENHKGTTVKEILTNELPRHMLADQYEHRLEKGEQDKNKAIILTEIKAKEYEGICENIDERVQKRNTLLKLYNPAIVKLKRLESVMSLVENKSRNNEAIKGLVNVLEDKNYIEELNRKKDELDTEFEMIEEEINGKYEIEEILNEEMNGQIPNQKLIDSKKPQKSIQKVLTKKSKNEGQTQKEKLALIRKELERV